MEKIKNKKMLMAIYRFNEKERLLITENGMIHSNSLNIDQECETLISMIDKNHSFQQILEKADIFLNKRPIFLELKLEDYRDFVSLTKNLN